MSHTALLQTRDSCEYQGRCVPVRRLWTSSSQASLQFLSPRHTLHGLSMNFKMEKSIMSFLLHSPCPATPWCFVCRRKMDRRDEHHHGRFA